MIDRNRQLVEDYAIIHNGVVLTDCENPATYAAVDVAGPRG